MQKKKDNFLDKIVKKNYNNELEEVLEKKSFEENSKSILLSILYRISAAYKDYKTVKVDVIPKEEFIQNIIDIIKNNCNDIKLVKPNSEENKIIGKKTFLVDKKNGRIICYPIERKLLYSIAKIGKRDKIIKDKYFIINKTLSDLITIGNNIEIAEVIRDFNGYSWTTLSKEIENVSYNVIYQELKILVGNKFLNKWITNKQYIIDYFELFKNKLEELYGTEKQEKMIDLILDLSVLLSIKNDTRFKNRINKLKVDVEQELEKMNNKKSFVEEITKNKVELSKRIKNIDETIYDKKLLQKEYNERNELLPLEKKIFSARILSELMAEERKQNLSKLEEYNKLLIPSNFVNHKEELEFKYRYLKLCDTEHIEKDIEKLIIEFQNLFLECYKIKIENAKTRQDIINLIYEFRYYCELPFNNKTSIGKLKKIQNIIKDIKYKLIQKSHELKVINEFSKNSEINYEILKNIFEVRIINLEDSYIKIIKEKEKVFIQVFDENLFEEKIELPITLEKKDLEVKANKKIKIFN